MCGWYVFVRVFFFFKQKTAYEMRISDWSSDVCSSDLDAGERDPGHAIHLGRQEQAVPVDGTIFVEIIDHVETHHLAFAKADEGGRHRDVHAGHSGLAYVDDHGMLRNPQGHFGARPSRKRYSEQRSVGQEGDSQSRSREVQ